MLPHNVCQLAGRAKLRSMIDRCTFLCFENLVIFQSHCSKNRVSLLVAAKLIIPCSSGTAHWVFDMRITLANQSPIWIVNIILTLDTKWFLSAAQKILLSQSQFARNSVLKSRADSSLLNCTPGFVGTLHWVSAVAEPLFRRDADVHRALNDEREQTFLYA